MGQQDVTDLFHGVFMCQTFGCQDSTKKKYSFTLTHTHVHTHMYTHTCTHPPTTQSAPHAPSNLATPIEELKGIDTALK